MILVTQHSPPRHDTTALTCTAFLRLFEVDFLKILFVLCPLVAIIVMKDEPVTNARARAARARVKNLKCVPLYARAARARARTFFFEETPCYKHRCPHDYNQPSAS